MLPRFMDRPIPNSVVGGSHGCLVGVLKPSVPSSSIPSSGIPSSMISVEASEIVVASSLFSSSSPLAGTGVVEAEPSAGLRIALRGHAIFALMISSQREVLSRPEPSNLNLKMKINRNLGEAT